MVERSDNASVELWFEIWAVIRRRYIGILLIMAITVLGTYTALSLITDVYEINAKLVVTLGRENTEVPIAVEKGAVFSSGVQKEEINSYIQLLSSRNLLKSVVDKVGIERFFIVPEKPASLFGQIKYYFKYTWRSIKKGVKSILVKLDLKKEISDYEKVVVLIERNLSVFREKDSNVITVSMRLADYNLATETVEALIEIYLRRHVEVRRAVGMQDVFSDQVEKNQMQLSLLQKKKMDIRKKWNLNAVEQQRPLLLGRLHQLETKLNLNQSEKSKLAIQLKDAVARLNDLPEKTMLSEVVDPSPSYLLMKKRLAELKLQRVTVANKYDVSSQPVKAIDDEINSLLRLVFQEGETQVGAVTYEAHPVGKMLQRDIEGYVTELSGIEGVGITYQKQILQIKNELSRLNEGEDQLRMVDLEILIVEERYMANTAKREETMVIAEMDAQRVANVAVLSAPIASAEPVYPRKMLIMIVIGCIGGMLLGVGYALIYGYFDDTVYSDKEISSIEGMSCIGRFKT